MVKYAVATENQEQRAIVKYLYLHPVLKDFYCKNNNEGKRTEAQTWHLKCMGLRPGVSDLFIYYPTAKYHGLFLEVKRNMSYPTSARNTDTWIAQELFIETVRSVGYAGHFCFGFENGKRIIDDYLSSRSF